MASVQELERAHPTRFWMPVVAVISVLTAPITAPWLLVFAPLALVLTAIFAACLRDPVRRDHIAAAGLGCGIGAMVGPVLYFGLAVVT